MAQTHNLAGLSSPNAQLKTETPTHLTTSDDTAYKVFNEAMVGLRVHYTGKVTTHISEKQEHVEIAEIVTEKAVDLATLASTMVLFSDKIYGWDFVNFSESVSSLYEAVGEWDKLYLLQKDKDIFLALNGKTLALRVNG